MERSCARWMKSLVTFSVAMAVGAALLCISEPASAQARPSLMTPTGGRGQLSIDELTGFRLGLASGISYAGPIGLAFQRYSADRTDPGGGADVYHYTTFWLAPAADYFVIEHLSVGGLIELSTTSGSVDRPVNNNATVSQDLPTTTAFTILPRVGYMIPLGDRGGIWPRGGLGYASRQIAAGNGNGKETFSSVIVDVDVGFLFRLNETFYLMGAPDVTFGLGGSHSATANNGASVSASASLFQFGLLSSLGIFLDL